MHPFTLAIRNLLCRVYGHAWDGEVVAMLETYAQMGVLVLVRPVIESRVWCKRCGHRPFERPKQPASGTQPRGGFSYSVSVNPTESEVNRVIRNLERQVGGGK